MTKETVHMAHQAISNLLVGADPVTSLSLPWRCFRLCCSVTLVVTVLPQSVSTVTYGRVGIFNRSELETRHSHGEARDHPLKLIDHDR